MGIKNRDRTDINATQESRQTLAIETQNTTTKESPNATKGSPDLRRRALIAGLATTPVLLSLSSRSALGQANVDCSLLSSIILGGSVHDLPPGFDHKNEDFIQNYYETHCVEGGEPGTGNATGNSGASGNSNGNATGNN